MYQWKGGGITGSLRGHIAWRVRHHQDTNKGLLQQRYSIGVRLLRNLMGNGSLTKILSQYALLVFLLILFELFIENSWPGFLGEWSCNSEMVGKIGTYFSGQTTMIGLIFPVAIGLVTLLVQREGAGSTNADIQVYYNESLAYQVGSSSICLIIALAIQFFFLEHFGLYFEQKTTANLIFKSFLPILHFLWLILNFIGLWHFLNVSLDFVQPTKRALLRKNFAANHIVPQEIFQMLQKFLYPDPSTSNWLQGKEGTGGESEKEEEVRVIIGYAPSFNCIPETYQYFSYPATLVDVRMRYLRWVVRNWLVRNKNCEKRSDEKNCLIFPLNIGSEVKGNTVLCYTIGDIRLNRLDKFVVWLSFSFKRKRK